LTGDKSQALEGEDLGTTHWKDARHWLGIYADLLEFKRGILDRIERDLSKLPPVAQAAAQRDVQVIEMQMAAYQERLDLWNQRVRDLHGLWLDVERHAIHYKSLDAKLTIREFQLLQFLLDRPYRYFSVPQILEQAWDQTDLFPEELRNYVLRLRRVFSTMKIPCELVNRPGRGYALTFNTDEPQPASTVQ
jgi:DNA-binding response OmpR family regulator